MENKERIRKLARNTAKNLLKEPENRFADYIAARQITNKEMFISEYTESYHSLQEVLNEEIEVENFEDCSLLRDCLTVNEMMVIDVLESCFDGTPEDVERIKNLRIKK